MRIGIILLILTAFCFNAQAQRYFVSEGNNTAQYWVLDSLSAEGFNMGKEVTKTDFDKIQSEILEREKKLSVQTPESLEINWLKINATSATYIYKRYNLSNRNKNGFSLRDLALDKGIDIDNKRKKDLSYEIYNSL